MGPFRKKMNYGEIIISEDIWPVTKYETLNMVWRLLYQNWPIGILALGISHGDWRGTRNIKPMSTDGLILYKYSARNVWIILHAEDLFSYCPSHRSVPNYQNLWHPSTTYPDPVTVWRFIGTEPDKRAGHSILLSQMCDWICVITAS